MKKLLTPQAISVLTTQKQAMDIFMVSSPFFFFIL